MVKFHQPQWRQGQDRADVSATTSSSRIGFAAWQGLWWGLDAGCKRGLEVAKHTADSRGDRGWSRKKSPKTDLTMLQLGAMPFRTSANCGDREKLSVSVTPVTEAMPGRKPPHSGSEALEAGETSGRCRIVLACGGNHASEGCRRAQHECFSSKEPRAHQCPWPRQRPPAEGSDRQPSWIPHVDAVQNAKTHREGTDGVEKGRD